MQYNTLSTIEYTVSSGVEKVGGQAVAIIWQTNIRQNFRQRRLK